MALNKGFTQEFIRNNRVKNDYKMFFLNHLKDYIYDEYRY